MLSAAIEIETHQCFECGCTFGVSASYMAHAIRSGKTICCPNGHENHFMTPDDLDTVAKLKEELSAHEITLQEYRAQITKMKGEMVDLRHRAEQAEAKASALSDPSIEGKPTTRRTDRKPRSVEA